MVREGRPRLFLALCLALALFGGVAIGYVSGQEVGCAASLDGEEAAFLSLVNAYRAQNGRAPVQHSQALAGAAQWMACDLAAAGYFSHTSSDGRSPSQRAASYGYPYGVSENIAGGCGSAAEVFECWRQSPGHNANMLGNHAVIGIGRALGGPYRVYWVTDFGGVASEPPPSPSPVPTPRAPPTPAPHRLVLPGVAKS